jgi:hypothetical protein
MDDLESISAEAREVVYIWLDVKHPGEGDHMYQTVMGIPAHKANLYSMLRTCITNRLILGFVIKARISVKYFRYSGNRYNDPEMALPPLDST